MKIETTATPPKVAIQIPPDPSPIQAPEIESRDFFKALTPAVTADLNAAVARGDLPPYAFVCLSDQAYLTLAAWVADVKRYAKDVAATLESYKRNIARESTP